MTFKQFAILLATANLTVAAPVSAEKVTKYDRFRFWNDCKPVQLVVARLNQNAKNIGLTEESIEAAARSRLRASRIFTADENHMPPTTLFVNVDIGKGTTFLVSVELWKWLKDDINGISSSWRSSTWDTYSYGTFGANSTIPISLVSQLVDKFIDEYLRVNAAACRR